MKVQKIINLVILKTVTVIMILSSCNNIVIETPKEMMPDSIIQVADSILLCKREHSIEDDYDDDPRIYPKQLDSTTIPIIFIPRGNYSALKTRIKSKRNEFTNSYINNTDSIFRKILLDSAKHYITRILLNEIYPFWYGTKWDFDGYTSKPNNGVVACGYFVSTTLRDVGFNLNRYHLAQQSPINEAKSLQFSNNVSIFDNEDYLSLKQTLLTIFKDGLYFIGLDNHVGFLWINNNEIYFIHSNYVKSEVQFEYAETSEAFLNNKQYIIVNITHNDSLIIKWTLNEEVSVFK